MGSIFSLMDLSSSNLDLLISLIKVGPLSKKNITDITPSPRKTNFFIV